MNLIDFARIARDFDFDLNPTEVYNHLKEFDKDIKISIEDNCFWYELPNLDFDSRTYVKINGEWYSEDDVIYVGSKEYNTDGSEPSTCMDIYFDIRDTIKYRVYAEEEGYPEEVLQDLD